MEYKKIARVLFALFTCIFFIYSLAKTDWTHTYRQEWEVCIDYLKEGTLYEGQPHCATGIMLFYVGYVFKETFGSTYQIAIKLFLVLMFVLYIFCLWKMVKKDNRQYDIWLLLLLSLVLVYPHLASDNLEKGLAMIFTFFGYYLLYHSKIKFYWAYVALCFSVAFFSSVQSIIIIAILIGWYPFQSGMITFSSEKGNGLSIKKNQLFILGSLLIICLAVFGILKLIYPNILTYILFAHSTDPLYTLGQAMNNLLPSASIDKDLFIVYIVLLLSIWVFYKNREVSPLAGGIGLAIIMLMQHKGSGGISIGRYMTPAFPFIILTLYQLKKMARKGNYSELLFPLVLFVLFIFPGVQQISFMPNLYEKFDYSLENFKREVGYGIHFIPDQQGQIAVDGPEILMLYEYLFAHGKVVIVNGLISHTEIDAWSGPRLEKLGMTRLTQWSPSQQIATEQAQAEQALITSIRQEMESGKYSLVLYGPGGNSAALVQAFNQLNESIRSGYCTVIFPNIEHTSTTSNHLAFAHLKNFTHCQQTVQRMAEYYYKAFDGICKKSRFAANNVVDFTFKRFYQIDLGKSCQKGGKFIENFNNDPLFPEHYLVILGIFFLIFSIGIVRLRVGVWEENKSLKKVHYTFLGIIIVLIILMLVLWVENIGTFRGF